MAEILTSEPKKAALIYVLKILQEHSDQNHPITQSEIVELLKEEYGLELERKAVGRNVTLLKDCGFDIEDNPTGNGVYLIPEFDESELRVLIDGVLSSKYITGKYSKELIKKLSNLASENFKKQIKYTSMVEMWDKTENKSIFYSIETIAQAVKKGVDISFDYNKYGIDKKLHKTSSQQVSPYFMFLKNQKYYLMSYNKKHGNISYYRVDRISNVQLMEDEKAFPKPKDIASYYKKLSTTPYMYGDQPVSVKLKCKTKVIDDVIEWFGKDVTISKLTNSEDEVLVNLICSPKAMKYWAEQYVDEVEVLTPKDLREKVRSALEEGLAKYSRTI